MGEAYCGHLSHERARLYVDTSMKLAFCTLCTEWIPPPRWDRGARTNDYHHPERLFDDEEAP